MTNCNTHKSKFPSEMIEECAGGASLSMRSVIFRRLRLCCTITIHFLQKALRQRFAMSAPVRCFWSSMEDQKRAKKRRNLLMCVKFLRRCRSAALRVSNFNAQNKIKFFSVFKTRCAWPSQCMLVKRHEFIYTLAFYHSPPEDCFKITTQTHWQRFWLKDAWMLAWQLRSFLNKRRGREWGRWPLGTRFE